MNRMKMEDTLTCHSTDRLFRVSDAQRIVKTTSRLRLILDLRKCYQREKYGFILNSFYHSKPHIRHFVKVTIKSIKKLEIMTEKQLTT